MQSPTYTERVATFAACKTKPQPPRMPCTAPQPHCIATLHECAFIRPFTNAAACSPVADLLRKEVDAAMPGLTSALRLPSVPCSGTAFRAHSGSDPESAPALGSPPPTSAHCCDFCTTKTGRTPAHICPLLRFLHHRDWAHPRPHLQLECAHPRHACHVTGLPPLRTPARIRSAAAAVCAARRRRSPLPARPHSPPVPSRSTPKP
jgi:hypothetical protein